MKTLIYIMLTFFLVACNVSESLSKCLRLEKGTVPENGERAFKCSIDLKTRKLVIITSKDAEQHSLQDILSSNSMDNFDFAINGPVFETSKTKMFADRVQIKGFSISDRVILNKKLDETAGTKSNYYSDPRGVFYIENSFPTVAPLEEFKKLKAADIEFAFQSAPILVQNGFVPANVKKMKGGKKNYSRTALCVDGTSDLYAFIYIFPLSIAEFAENLREKGCANAIFIDGGYSDLKIYGGYNGIYQNMSTAIVVKVR